VSAAVKVFHAMGAYLSLDLTEVKYKIRRLSTDEMEKPVAPLGPSNFIFVKIYSPHVHENILSQE
jgi:hypothetical protein